MEAYKHQVQSFSIQVSLQASALSGVTISITSVDIDASTDIGTDLVDADLLLVDDDGTNRKSALSRVKKYIYSAVSGDATVSDTALTIASGPVENAMLAVFSIANSKLTNSTITVTDAPNSTATALGKTITFEQYCKRNYSYRKFRHSHKKAYR